MLVATAEVPALETSRAVPTSPARRKERREVSIRTRSGVKRRLRADEEPLVRLKTPDRPAGHRAFTDPSPLLHVAASASARAGDTLRRPRTEENDVRHRLTALTSACVAVLVAVLGGLVLAASPASAAAALTPTIRISAAGATPKAAASLPEARVGQVVDVRLAGFGPGAQVLVSIGPAALPRLVITDKLGAGHAVAVVPKLPTDSYLVTAASRSATASVPLHVTAVGKVSTGSTVVRWYAPVSASTVRRVGTSLPSAATVAASAKKASSAKAASPAATARTSSAAGSSTAPGASSAPRNLASDLSAAALAALPASATSTPPRGWLGLGSLLALALGGSVAALAWGLRRSAEVESLGRHAYVGTHSAPPPDVRE